MQADPCPHAAHNARAALLIGARVRVRDPQSDFAPFVGRVVSWTQQSARARVYIRVAFPGHPWQTQEGDSFAFTQDEIELAEECSS